MIVTNDYKVQESTLNPVDAVAEPTRAVEHPKHYNQGGVECIDALDSCGFGLDFCVGNAIKYLWRFKEKAKPVEDLEKARWYLDHAIENLKDGSYKL